MFHRSMADIFAYDLDKSPLFSVLLHGIILFLIVVYYKVEKLSNVLGLGLGLELSMFNSWYSPCYFSGIQKTLKQGNPDLI